MASSKLTIVVALIAIFAIALPNIADAQRGRGPGGPRGGQGGQRGQADCPAICPALFSPVCATLVNGQKMQFSNSCELNVATCQNKIRKLLNALKFWETLTLISFELHFRCAIIQSWKLLTRFLTKNYDISTICKLYI